MRKRHELVALGLLMVACGSESSTNPSGAAGAQAATGGTAGSGGLPPAGVTPGVGGASLGSTGGVGSTSAGGGTATGGVGPSGGTGGLAPSGGGTGGVVSTGGSTGGRASTGGSTGGIQPSGGTTGGPASSGGSTSDIQASGGRTGGLGSTGGSDSGTGGGGPAAGSDNSGGSASGGASVGEPTGGVGGDGGSQGGESGGTGGTIPDDQPEFVTSAPNAYWQTGTLTVATGNADITVNASQEFQDWIGFGGTFNEMGWEAMSTLDDVSEVIGYLFGQGGLRFTWGRIPVGASDYALDRYTLNETSGDYAMASFSIARDLESLIPYIHAAQEVRPDIRFWGSPWTPPTWMKDNGSFDHGNMKSDAQTLQAHALYLQKWVEAYEEQGIPISWIMPQNEPGYSQDYPSCLWSAQTMTNYIGNYLGPLFAEQVPDTEVWLGTMSNPNDSQIVSSVMGDATARGYVKGLALQWGMEQSAGQYDTQYTSIPMIQSEHKCGNYPWDAGTNQSRAPNDDAYARESWTNIKSWISNGVHAYLAWNMVLDPIGRSLDTVRPWAQNALITVDPNTRQVVRTPTYYVFQHLAHFVDPGAKRIGTSGSFGDALAFKNPDGSIVAVLYNSGGSPKQTTLTSGATTVSFSVPGQGWATVNLAP